MECSCLRLQRKAPIVLVVAPDRIGEGFRFTRYVCYYMHIACPCMLYRIPLMPRRKAASEADQQAPSATPGKADPKKDKAAAKREFLNSYVQYTQHNS